MADIFEYNVFLSFSSEDVDSARPIWQKMRSSGLRVFWSDETLKKELGKNWFNAIQNSLIQSEHFVLLCSPNALESKWVEKEYQTFFTECYFPSNEERRLIVFPLIKYKRTDLPPFLRTLQTATSIDLIISELGGADVQALKAEISGLKRDLVNAHAEIEQLKKAERPLSKQNESFQKKIRQLEQTIKQLEKDKKLRNETVIQLKKKQKRDKSLPGGIEDISGITMVSIPADTFQMGSNDGESEEKPVHTVSLYGFEMSATEITQAQYKAIVGSNPSYFSGSEDLPVENVSWGDAVKFCNLLSDKAGLERCYNERWWKCDFTKNGIRLPTEAEWEYACRAGTPTKYYIGESESDLTRAGWYNRNSAKKTHAVGQKEPNDWGLYDMHGNVWEWCNDWYDSDYYSSSPSSNPAGPTSGSFRVMRGSGWHDSAGDCRSVYRHREDPTDTFSNVGFRVVRKAGQ